MCHDVYNVTSFLDSWSLEGETRNVVPKRRLLTTNLRFVTFHKSEDLVYNVAYVSVCLGVADVGIDFFRKFPTKLLHSRYLRPSSLGSKDTRKSEL